MFVREAVKSVKTESDLDDFRKMLTKVTIETALSAELDYEYTLPNSVSIPAMVTSLNRSLLTTVTFRFMCLATERHKR